MKLPVQLYFPELLQCSPKVLPMLVKIATENQNVLQIRCNESSYIINEDLVHQPLKTCRCVAQPKKHDEKLKVTAISMESCLLYQCLLHLNLVVSRCEIQHRKNLAWPNLSKSESMQGNGNCFFTIHLLRAL